MKTTITLSILLTIALTADLNAQNMGMKANNFSVDLLDGSKFQLSSYEGEYVLIFFFGHACPACRSIGGTIQSKLFDQYKDYDGFNYISIDTWDGNKNEVLSFINFTGIDSPIGVQGSGAASTVSTTYDRLMLLDDLGTIRYKGSTAENNYASIKAILDPVFTSTNVNANQLDGLNSIYPNPATEVFTISLTVPETKLYQFRIFSLTGQLVFNEKQLLNNGNRKVTLQPKLPKGIYTIEISTDKKITNSQLILN